MKEKIYEKFLYLDGGLMGLEDIERVYEVCYKIDEKIETVIERRLE